ncbi:glycosyl transferase family protein [Natrinema pallidum DSM 3751]|uniref:Glycosyl transferase family protein n=1 Tax=Natrinema pallidum DSM 3751 TaxID=1227495 RepID=L9Z190_9EURY|nr:glycosyl transferase family protein [Natrinema pallidum DSM 3751]
MLQQTSSNFSIFAVDDGSDDETFDKLADKVDDAADAGVPMRVWKKENQGFTISIKRAIEEHSDSKIIALHGAGDISKPSRLEKQYRCLETNAGIIAVGCECDVIDHLGEIIAERTTPEYPERDLQDGTIPRPGTHGECMYYRKQYQKCGGYREPFEYGQDTDLWLRLYELGDFYSIQDKLYQKLKSTDTIQGGREYDKRIRQVICSGAAIKSAEIRNSNGDDPIGELDDFHFSELCSITRMGEIPEPTIRGLIRVSFYNFMEGNIRNSVSALNIMRLDDVNTVLKQVPKVIAISIYKKYYKL